MHNGLCQVTTQISEYFTGLPIIHSSQVSSHSLHPSQVQILSSASRSQTHTICSYESRINVPYDVIISLNFITQ